MGEKGDFKSKLGGFADKLKINQVTPPLQEVVPVHQAGKEEKSEAQLNVWVPKDLLKKMKRHGLDADMSLKEITIKAVEAYLDRLP